MRTHRVAAVVAVGLGLFMLVGTVLILNQL
jgi:hypothetical protein